MKYIKTLEELDLSKSLGSLWMGIKNLYYGADFDKVKNINEEDIQNIKIEKKPGFSPAMGGILTFNVGNDSYKIDHSYNEVKNSSSFYKNEELLDVGKHSIKEIYRKILKMSGNTDISRDWVHTGGPR